MLKCMYWGKRGWQGGRQEREKGVEWVLTFTVLFKDWKLVFWQWQYKRKLFHLQQCIPYSRYSVLCHMNEWLCYFLFLRLHPCGIKAILKVGELQPEMEKIGKKVHTCGFIQYSGINQWHSFHIKPELESHTVSVAILHILQMITKDQPTL